MIKTVFGHYSTSEVCHQHISFQSVQIITTVVHISVSNGPFLREVDVLPIKEKYWFIVLHLSLSEFEFLVGHV